MKYKNYKWKLATSMMIPIGIVFGISMVLMLVLLIAIGNYKSIPLIGITFAVMIIPIYIIFLILGDILYHKSKFSIKHDGIYQNKRLLKYENIKQIFIGKMGQIYSFQILPIKDGFWVSKRIIIYFYSLEEVYHFIITHNLTSLLSYDYQYIQLASYIKKIIKENGEKLHPDFINFFNEQTTICACCGNRTIFKRIRNDICPVCFWEHDEDNGILYNPNIVSEVNHISLIQAKKNYEQYGASSWEYRESVRKPFSFELPDYNKINK